MSEMLAPLSSQITISPKFSESLKVDRITAALDKPIVIDSPLDKVEVNGNIDLVAKQKTDFLGVETTDTKVQISSPENQKNGKEYIRICCVRISLILVKKGIKSESLLF